MDGKTGLFEKKIEPGIIRCSSPGKLVRYLVADGAHIEPGTIFAEVEVMKMHLSITCNEAGNIFHTKQPGATLEIGDIIANIKLDDPSKMRVITSYDKKFLDTFRQTVQPNKVHQVLKSVLSFMNNVLAGYYYPEPFFTELLHENLKKAQDSLLDPKLPLYEFQELLASLSGRIPSFVENKITKLLQGYEHSVGSLFSTFPASDIRAVIESQQIADNDKYLSSVGPLLDLTERYKHRYRK